VKDVLRSLWDESDGRLQFLSEMRQRPMPKAVDAHASRVAGHSRLLGILWLTYSAVRLIPGLGLLSVSSHVFDFLSHHLPGIVHGIFQAVELSW